MSDPLPPIPFRRTGAVLAWLVVLAVAGGGLVGHILSLRSDLAARAAGTPPAATPASRLGLRFQARYAVAVQQLQPGNPAVATLIAAIEADSVRDDHDRLRVAVIAGEVLGAAAARERLAALAPAAGTEAPAIGADAALADDHAALQRLYADGAAALSTEQRAGLRQRHRWFGDLALAHGLPAGDAQRQAALRPAYVLLGCVVVAAIVGGLALLAGLVLAILAGVALANGRLRDAQGRAGAGHPALIEAFALYLVAFLAASALRPLLGWSNPHLTWLLLPILVPLVWGWLRLRGMDGAAIRHAFGLHRGAGVWREIGAGVVGWLAALPLIALLMVGLGMLLKELRLPEPSHPVIIEAVGSGWLGVIGIYLLASVWAPLTEELMFRGALLHHLRGALPLALAALVGGLIFAIVHPQGILLIVPLAVLGAVFACIRAWRGSLIAPMAAHALHNGVVTTWLVIMTR